MTKSKKKYYAVAIGRKPGIYKKWYGEDGAEAQIKKYSNALCMSFATKKEAELFLTENLQTDSTTQKKSANNPSTNPNVIIYTDGGCINNPGPGGYGVVLKNAKKRKELSGGFRLTIEAAIEFSVIEDPNILHLARLLSDNDPCYVPKELGNILRPRVSPISVVNSIIR
jgi:ribonuclease HI